MTEADYWSDLNTALNSINRLDGSAPVGKRRGAEARYAQAYQGLVRLGVVRQIRYKYRTVR